jgi:hypothetical protein
MTPKEVDELLEEMVEEGNLEVNRLQEPHFYTHKKRKKMVQGSTILLPYWVSDEQARAVHTRIRHHCFLRTKELVHGLLTWSLIFIPPSRDMREDLKVAIQEVMGGDPRLQSYIKHL